MSPAVDLNIFHKRTIINKQEDYFKSLFTTSDARPSLEIINVSTEFNKNSVFIEGINQASDAELDKKYKLTNITNDTKKGFPIFSSLTCNSVLFIDGFGSDHILTYSLGYRKPIILLRDEHTPFRLWYETMFIPYDFSEDYDNSNANIFILEMSDILVKYNKKIDKKNLDKKDKEHKLLETLKEEIYKCNRIVSNELMRYKSEEDTISISNRELQQNKSKYALLGGILENSLLLSNNILGDVIHANSKKEEDANSNKIYQLLAASINSVSFNFVREPMVLKSKENIGNIISCRIPIKELYLPKIKDTILNNDLTTYELEEPFMMSGIKYLYIKLSIDKSLFNSIINKIQSLDPDESGEDTPPFQITPEKESTPDDVYKSGYGAENVRADGSLITPPGDSPPPYTPLTPPDKLPLSGDSESPPFPITPESER